MGKQRTRARPAGPEMQLTKNSPAQTFKAINQKKTQALVRTIPSKRDSARRDQPHTPNCAPQTSIDDSRPLTSTDRARVLARSTAASPVPESPE
ncbi:hypothetical protein MCOR28_009240 [Pyricularia oryzae]|nr:hypothetical protein MCOR28_009240 [Pyricularia oryzae]